MGIGMVKRAGRAVPAALVCGLALGAVAPSASGQVVRERDVKVTGPRGRSVERRLENVRTPNGLSRETVISRPGGTYQRDVNIQRGPAFGPGPGRGFIPGPGPYRGFGPVVRNNVFVERDVIVERPPFFGPALAVAPAFAVAPFLNFSFNSNPAPPPPPANVVVNPPVPYQQQNGQAPTVVVDPVNDAIARLSSRHDNSRRDGALTLGRMGDSRAVGPLVDRLKYDSAKDVRIAAATALGNIGDPAASVYLERAIVYDKKQAVRDAAAAALARLPKAAPVQPAAAAPAPVARASREPEIGPATTLEPIEQVPPNPEPVRN